jgi:predicted AAA+ superfamily ATPase
MILRETYLEKLRKSKDLDFIKVITGIRRSGKSTLLKQFQAELIKSGIPQKNIISVNFEDLESEPLLDYHQLYKHLNEQLNESESFYLFLDEIQQVANFEKVLNSLFLKKNVDIYVTGSNAYMLSGELATLLSGRYIEVPVYPLSFKEFHAYQQGDSITNFYKYLEKGGFPYTTQIFDEQILQDYMQGIINTVLIKDVLNRKKQSDSLLVESIVKFIFSSSGSLISIKKIVDTLTSMSRKTSSPTLESYLSALLEAFVFFKVDRYDVHGKKHLQLNSKYYVVDVGLKNAYLGKHRNDIGHDLENIVYLELLRRGYDVFIGSIPRENVEIDFIAQKNGEKHYFQVSATVMDQSTFAREVKSLQLITDNFPKMLLTLDRITTGKEGIKQINLIDWLLGET